MIVISPTIKDFDYFRCQYGETGWIYYPKTTPYRHRRCELDYAEDNRRWSKVQGFFLLIEIVPSVSFSPRTNVYGRMSDKVFPMIEWVGLYKYIWLQRIYPLA